MRTCLFGGTFDPIHCGHLILAEWVCSEMRMDKMVFIPAGSPPHKSLSDITPANHRLKMTELAIADNHKFSCSDMEIFKRGPSYTEEMIALYFRDHPESIEDTFMLIGADSLCDIHLWKNPENILNAVHVLVIMRPGFSTDSVSSLYLDKVTLLESPYIEISSSSVRLRVKKGESIKYFVPHPVAEYIQHNGLYR